MDAAAFDLPDIHRLLDELLAQIPRGRVTTYGDLGDALGNRLAAKWVGHELLNHDHGDGCHCHRVLRAGGLLGGYASGDPADKASRLEREGVEICEGVVDLERFGFQEFQSDQPLVRLRLLQESLRERIVLQSVPQMPAFIGGVDASYVSQQEGIAAYALVEISTGQLAWSTTVRAAARFPYITSFLTFRELPLYLTALQAAREAGRLAEVVLVDGTGVLHPRRMGIATHLGIAAGLPTIGVAKTQLCGVVGEAPAAASRSGKRTRPTTRPVTIDRLPVGAAIFPTPTAKNPIYVSPGHLTDLAFAQAAVERLLAGHRLPEPLYWADRLSRHAAQAARD